MGGLGRILGASATCALLGFHDKMPSAVKVDKAARLGGGVDEGHGMFETIGVIAHGFGCGCGARHAQNVSQFVREGLKVRPFAAAGCLPAGDKFLNLQKPVPTTGLFNLLTFLHRHRNI
jgi:hypothetical protein